MDRGHPVILRWIFKKATCVETHSSSGAQTPVTGLLKLKIACHPSVILRSLNRGSGILGPRAPSTGLVIPRELDGMSAEQRGFVRSVSTDL